MSTLQNTLLDDIAAGSVRKRRWFSLDRRGSFGDRQLAQLHTSMARAQPHHLTSMAPLNPVARA